MTFLEWLSTQKGRNDPVGDFAVDALSDKSRPDSSSLLVWREHLGDAQACIDAKRALREAHAEYRTTKPDAFVYVWGGEGIYKIGRAKNPRQRIKSFPILPYETAFVHILPTSDAQRLERHLHNHFRSNRIQGEWFNLTDIEIESIPQVAGTPSLSEADLPSGRTHWDLLIEAEPRLLDLYKQARAIKDTREKSAFCANEVWYVQFKPQLVELVGWSATNIFLRNMDALPHELGRHPQ